LFLL
jgi:hypothetical protein